MGVRYAAVAAGFELARLAAGALSTVGEEDGIGLVMRSGVFGPGHLGWAAVRIEPGRAPHFPAVS